VATHPTVSEPRAAPRPPTRRPAPLRERAARWHGRRPTAWRVARPT